MSDNIVGVGLLLFTELDNDLYAILQRRGPFDLDKSQAQNKLMAESKPGLYQLTAHGRLLPLAGDNEWEAPMQALLGECDEELGEEITDFIRDNFDQAHGLGESKGKDGLYLNYCFFISSEYLLKLRLHASSGGLYLVSDKDLENIEVWQAGSVPRAEKITMFADDFQALRRAFLEMEDSV